MLVRIAHHCSLSLVVTVACLWTVTSLGCADRATPPQASAPSATIVSVEGASATGVCVAAERKTGKLDFDVG